MAGRSFWGWFKHRLGEFRRNKIKLDEHYNVHLVLFYFF